MGLVTRGLLHALLCCAPPGRQSSLTSRVVRHGSVRWYNSCPLMSISLSNRREYENRVNRVIDYVRAHRADVLTVEGMARVAAFSPFHFHRIFKSITGENLNEFVQRIRLEWAASALTMRPQEDVLGIALDSGFQSASAFARAFKQRFGMSATEWRQGGGQRWADRQMEESKTGKAQSKPRKAVIGGGGHDASVGQMHCPQEDIKMNVTIKTLPPLRIAYMRHTGPYGAAVGGLWQSLRVWADAHGLWTDARVCLGISHDDPRFTAPDKCRYDAAIAVPDDMALGPQVNEARIAEAKLAAGRFVGLADDVGAAWESLYRDWLPQSGFQPDDGPCLELYGADAFDPATRIFRCDLCLPIKPL